VVALAESRLASGSLPGRRIDGFNFCLAIEGGGMRGVVSAGMVTALEELGLRDLFDAVYGTSAGAINGAFFLADQAAFGTTIYYENVNNSRFIARRRIISPGPVMSLEFLLDQVIAHEKILDWQAVLDSAVPLKVVVTSLERRQAELLQDFSSREELWESLRASSSVPVIAGLPVEIGDERYIDGNVYAAIPLELAIADRCTHVLVLQTWPGGLERPTPGPLRRWVVRRYLRSFDPELAREYGRGPSAHEDAIEAIRVASASGDGPPYVLGVTLEPELALSTSEKSRDRLIGGAQAGFQALVRIFGHLAADSVSPLPDWKP
jgi:predicted patatin/cPLA2 family phospholipase